ncbi:hypothetical protein [Virgibacillus phage Mimir87]|nr:hypothetical protein [Virgibacillus phage Mimir87]
MGRTIYEFELLYNGRPTTWEFDNAQERNDFYTRVKGRFSEEEYQNKNEALAKGNIIQISTINVRQDSLNSVADIVPYEFYDGNLIDELTDFINKEYSRQ